MPKQSPLNAHADHRAHDPRRLTRAHAQVYSQNYEDGYVAEIFSRIGPRSRTFLEIGIGNGQQNTTRFLLEQGWHGVWVEGNPHNAAQAARTFSTFVDRDALKILSLLVTVENINQALDEAAVSMDFDYISVDVDQNTSHIWRALNRHARVSCIEYNASIPPSVAVEVPYDPAGAWDGTNHFGAGLKVIELIGKSKDMRLVACDPQGVNGYLVASSETANLFCAPFTAENHFELPRYDLSCHRGHPPAVNERRWCIAPEAGGS
jgi:hypothetical protein